MFKSIKYVRYDIENNQYIYLLIDSDFTIKINIDADGGTGSGTKAGIILIKEYQKRNINPAPQLALWNKWTIEKYKFDIFSKESKNHYSAHYYNSSKEFYKYERCVKRYLK